MRLSVVVLGWLLLIGLLLGPLDSGFLGRLVFDFGFVPELTDCDARRATEKRNVEHTLECNFTHFTMLFPAIVMDFVLLV